MVNWLAAIGIGIVIGGAAALILGRRSPSARWMAPVLSVVGALIAAGIAAAVGHAGYGWKKASLQVVLALVGAGVAALLARRGASASGPSVSAGS
jgi:uncharacterized membrane protein YeaQ/YmgE (transglycosylase-associated protein family)